MKFASLLLAMSLSTPALAVDTVRWNFNNKAVASGTACSSVGSNPDTFIIAAGNDVSVVFSRLGVNLGDRYTPLSERHNCSVRIPVQIMKGHYIGVLEQTFLYGVTKSARATGDLGATATFFNQPAAIVSKRFPAGMAMDGALQSLRKVNRYQVSSSSEWCGNTPYYRGIYAVNFAVTGRRPTLDDSVVIQVDGEDMRFSVRGAAHPCQR